MALKKIIEKVSKLAKKNNLNVIDYLRTMGIINPTIVNHIKKRKEIIYGGKALNAQVPFPYKREAPDFDVYSNAPERSAIVLDEALDKARNGNYHYVKKASHKGTFRLMDIGLDLKKGTDDDINLADFTKLSKKLAIVKIHGQKYVTLEEIKKSKLKTLKKKIFEFRWKKDKGDVKRIKSFKKKGRWL